MQDFVRLAKWEDRGYYAMKVSTERNQRQLHRLTRRAEEALSHPAATVLAAASKAMGLADLADADLAHGHLPDQDAFHAKKLRGKSAPDALSPEQASWAVCAWGIPCDFCLRNNKLAGRAARRELSSIASGRSSPLLQTMLEVLLS